MSSVRRVYFYLVCLITLGIFAAGIGVLLALVFDLTISGSTAIGQPNFVQQQLSLGLAMLVIGGPLWFFFWRSIRKHVVGNNTEIGATLRKFFLNLILLVSSLMAVFSGQIVLSWLLAGFPQIQDVSNSLATLIVTLLIWLYHWRVSENEGHPSSSAKTLRRWYVYIASGWGLVLLTLGLVQLVDNLSINLPFWGDTLTGSILWSTPIQDNISAVFFGFLLWTFHWFRMSKGDTDSTLRQVYIYLLAIVVSSISGLVALTIGLYHTLNWIIGGVNPTGTYFQYLGWVIPTLITTLAIWVYHQSVAREEASQLQERMLSSKRIHLYIMSFISLGTLTSGLLVLIGTLLDLVINSLNPAIVLQAGWWQRQLSLSLSLLIVAVPLWLTYWNQIIKISATGGIVEWRARSRRIYLYVIIGASIIALAATLVNIVYQFLSSALTGNLNVSVLQNSKWSIQILVVAIPLLVYHWQIARKDQHRGAEVAAIHKTITALIDIKSRYVIEQLEKKLGNRIHVLESTAILAGSRTFTDDDFNSAISEIQSSPTQQVMLMIYGDKILVLPFQEK